MDIKRPYCAPNTGEEVRSMAKRMSSLSIRGGTVDVLERERRERERERDGSECVCMCVYVCVLGCENMRQNPYIQRTEQNRTEQRRDKCICVCVWCMWWLQEK